MKSKLKLKTFRQKGNVDPYQQLLHYVNECPYDMEIVSINLVSSCRGDMGVYLWYRVNN